MPSSVKYSKLKTDDTGNLRKNHSNLNSQSSCFKFTIKTIQFIRSIKKWFLRPILRLKCICRYIFLIFLLIILVQIHNYNYDFQDIKNDFTNQALKVLHNYQHSKEFQIISRAYDRRFGDGVSSKRSSRREKICLENSLVLSLNAEEAYKNGEFNNFLYNDNKIDLQKYPRPITENQSKELIKEMDSSTDYFILMTHDKQGYPLTTGESIISAKLISPTGWILLAHVNDRKDGSYIFEFDYKRSSEQGMVFFDSQEVNSGDGINIYLSISVLQDKADTEVILRMMELLESDNDGDESNNDNSRSRNHRDGSLHHRRERQVLPIGISYFELWNDSVQPMTLNTKTSKRVETNEPLSKQLTETRAKCHTNANYIRHLTNNPINCTLPQFFVSNPDSFICECNKISRNLQATDFASLAVGKLNFGFVQFLESKNVSMMEDRKNYVSLQKYKKKGHSNDIIDKGLITIFNAKSQNVAYKETYSKKIYHIDLLKTQSKWQIPGYVPDYKRDFRGAASEMILYFKHLYFIGDQSARAWMRLIKIHGEQLVEFPLENEYQIIPKFQVVRTDQRYRAFSNSLEPESYHVNLGINQGSGSISYISNSQPISSYNRNYLFFTPSENLITIPKISAFSRKNNHKALLFISLGQDSIILGENYFRNRLIKIKESLVSNPFDYFLIIKLLDYKIPIPHDDPNTFSPYLIDKFNQIIKEVFHELSANQSKNNVIYADAWKFTLALSKTMKKCNNQTPDSINRAVLMDVMRRVKEMNRGYE